MENSHRSWIGHVDRVDKGEAKPKMYGKTNRSEKTIDRHMRELKETYEAAKAGSIKTSHGEI